jgi:hypothetical protein
MSIPYKSSTSAYKIQAKTRSRACIRALPHATTSCHVSRGSRPHLLARKSSGTATSPTAPDPASLLGRAPMLPCVSRLTTLPPCSKGLRRCHVFPGSEPRLPAREQFRCCHVSHASGPCLLAWESSSVATCSTGPDSASMPGRASELPHVPRLRTPAPYSGGLRHCHMSHDSRPHLPTSEGSGATICPTALDPASLLRRAPVPSHAPWLRT